MLWGVAFGFMLPDRILSSLVSARSRRLRGAIPPALDLMVWGMDAGQSLDQSIADASRGLKRTYPDLKRRAGPALRGAENRRDRATDFRSLGVRNNEPELRRFANLLIDRRPLRSQSGSGASLAGQVSPVAASTRSGKRSEGRKEAGLPGSF
jgi:Flp pilus assembly protein TadB